MRTSARRCSLPGDRLFDPIFVSDSLLDATSDVAWLQAMLDAESALAAAEASCGVVPEAAAREIGAACDVAHFDIAALGRDARAGGNPVIPLVTALEAAVPEHARVWVHWGATSQDILDTAAMLVARRSAALIATSLERLVDCCAGLAVAHRGTLMAGRTLLRQALPITFGLKAAGWLCAVDDARRELERAVAGLAVQLGGAAGTLASLDDAGPAVVASFAGRLGLADPGVPWHTARQRVAVLGGALAVVAGTVAKISADVALLMQDEVAEAFEPAPGASSAMPHKRNPVSAAAVLAAARRVHALAPVLFASLVAEHERPVGAWHAEWQPLGEALALCGGAAERTAGTVAGLRVDPEAMRSNLSSGGGTLMAERVALELAASSEDRSWSRRVVNTALGRVTATSVSFGDALKADPAVGAVIDEAHMARLLDPAGYLGSANTWIDRALARHGGTEP